MPACLPFVGVCMLRASRVRARCVHARRLRAACCVRIDGACGRIVRALMRACTLRAGVLCACMLCACTMPARMVRVCVH
eukprot:1600878-Pleurochrysis_carterae.AAC.2